jgi:hypothetical protein
MIENIVAFSILTLLTFLNAGALLLIHHESAKVAAKVKKFDSERKATKPAETVPLNFCEVLAVRAWHVLCKETGTSPDLLAGTLVQLLRDVMCYDNHTDESWEKLLNKIEATVWPMLPK